MLGVKLCKWLSTRSFLSKCGQAGRSGNQLEWRLSQGCMDQIESVETYASAY